MKRAIVVLSLILLAVACRKHEAPGSIPQQGLALWLRADAGVTADASGNVSAWASQSSPIKAVADKANQQPKLVANDIGGKPAVHFDGKDNILTAPLDINPSAAPQLTVISVFKSDTDARSPLRKLYGHDDGGYDRTAGLDNRASDTKENYVIFGGTAGVVGIFALQANTPYVTVDSYDNAQKTINTWVNGAPAKQNIRAEHQKGLTTFSIGASGTYYHEMWMGSVAEMLVYTRTLSDNERKTIETNLAAKYHLTLTR